MTLNHRQFLHGVGWIGRISPNGEYEWRVPLEAGEEPKPMRGYEGPEYVLYGDLKRAVKLADVLPAVIVAPFNGPKKALDLAYFHRHFGGGNNDDSNTSSGSTQQQQVENHHHHLPIEYRRFRSFVHGFTTASYTRGVRDGINIHKIVVGEMFLLSEEEEKLWLHFAKRLNRGFTSTVSEEELVEHVRACVFFQGKNAVKLPVPSINITTPAANTPPSAEVAVVVPAAADVIDKTGETSGAVVAGPSGISKKKEQGKVVAVAGTSSSAAADMEKLEAKEREAATADLVAEAVAAALGIEGLCRVTSDDDDDEEEGGEGNNNPSGSTRPSSSSSKSDTTTTEAKATASSSVENQDAKNKKKENNDNNSNNPEFEDDYCEAESLLPEEGREYSILWYFKLYQNRRTVEGRRLIRAEAAGRGAAYYAGVMRGIGIDRRAKIEGLELFGADEKYMMDYHLWRILNRDSSNEDLRKYIPVCIMESKKKEKKYEKLGKRAIQMGYSYHFDKYDYRLNKVAKTVEESDEEEFDPPLPQCFPFYKFSCHLCGKGFVGEMAPHKVVVHHERRHKQHQDLVIVDRSSSTKEKAVTTATTTSTATTGTTSTITTTTSSPISSTAAAASTTSNASTTIASTSSASTSDSKK